MSAPLEKSSSPTLTDGSPDAAERLLHLWQAGQRPDVTAFLAQAGPLAPTQLAAVLRVDQRQRWQAGERVPAEVYLQRHPELEDDTEAALDVVFHEYLMRERLGETPDPAELPRRFPRHAETLRAQIDLHLAVAADADASRTAVRQPTPGGASAARGLPEVFGRYRVHKKLGQGGMATVYLAHDTQLDRPVALKVPRFGEVEDPVLIERFQREARIAATLRHPNLCPVYDLGQIDGVHFLAMPLLTGETLAARLQREGRLSAEVAVRFAVRIARAVQTMHAAGILHRDLKPSNVMIDAQDEPMVMDFGLARRSAAGDARLTGTAVFLGTPAYAPPEQIGSGAEALGPASDVYSLGAVLYEMLTGRLPFQGAVHEIMQQVLIRAPEPPSRFVPGLAPGLEAVCMKALAKDAAARFPSMSAFADALERGHAGEGQAAVSGTEPTLAAPRVPGVRSPRARRLAWLVPLCGVVILLLGVVGWLAGWFSPGQAADAVQAGSRWTGRADWLPNLTPGPTITVVVQERSGDAFKGTYTALDNGQRFEWRIAGTVRDGAVQWRFTQALKEPFPTGVVEKAHVEGHVLGDVLETVFRDADSSAKMRLRLQK
jgi:tRNA A-37 threonylcarbamoyl transferase component Bud32